VAAWIAVPRFGRTGELKLFLHPGGILVAADNPGPRPMSETPAALLANLRRRSAGNAVHRPLHRAVAAPRRRAEAVVVVVVVAGVPERTE